ncbi:MAG: hypothetical protein ACI96P_000753 [Candidatus Azotimanducaceae bacterium]|jgi:hypothetical protein
MSQFPTDVSADNIAWGNKGLLGSQRRTLEQRWTHLNQQHNARMLNRRYAAADARSRLEFRHLAEPRFPVSAKLTRRRKLSHSAVVTRISQAIHLPATTRVRLYIGTHLWLRLQRHENVLIDMPVAHRSDTWCRPDTMHGKICYASQTHARLPRAGIAANPFKAITPVTIANATTQLRVLKCISPHVHHLSLYSQPSGDDKQRYWTSAITITSVEKSLEVDINVISEAPAESANPTLLSAGRDSLAIRRLRKTLTHLLG